MRCFRCSGPNGVARTSHAMRKDWYETALPSRTVHLCESCYIPDPQGGKRTEAVWEQHETLWEAFEHRDETAYEWGRWDNAVRALENAA